MTKLSTTQEKTARNNERTILHALAVVTQKRVSEMTGVSESRISRMKDGDLETLCTGLAALNLKLVPADAHVVSEVEYRFMAEQMIRHYQAVIEKEQKWVRKKPRLASGRKGCAMTTFEKWILALLAVQTITLWTVLWLCIRQDWHTVRLQLLGLTRRLQRPLHTLSPQQLEAPAVQKYLRWTEYPQVVLSQYPLIRRFYFARLRKLRALLTDSSESGIS